jgi:pantothenate kinase
VYTGDAVSLTVLAAEVRQKASEASALRRFVLGIAGPPAGGKSTLAELLRDEINAQAGSRIAEIAPMDGFHFTNRELTTRGDLHRKGEPDTFDVAAYCEKLRAVRQGRHVSGWPTFDRVLHDPTPNGVMFGADTAIAITEGNYLLLDAGGWSQVREYLDDAWYLDADDDDVKKRLLARYLKGGKSQAEAAAKISSSDMPNARLIAQTKARARLVLRWATDGYRVISSVKSW